MFALSVCIRALRPPSEIPKGAVRRHIVLFSLFVFYGASRTSPRTINGGDLVRRHFVCPCRLFAKREAKRLPYKRDFIQRRNVVRIYQKPSPVGEGGSRRLTDEVSLSLFALPFGGAQINENHLTPCRDRRPRLSVSLFALSFGFNRCLRSPLFSNYSLLLKVQRDRKEIYETL